MHVSYTRVFSLKTSVWSKSPKESFFGIQSLVQSRWHLWLWWWVKKSQFITYPTDSGIQNKTWLCPNSHLMQPSTCPLWAGSSWVVPTMIVLYFWMFSIHVFGLQISLIFLRHKIIFKERIKVEIFCLGFPSSSRLPCSPPLVLNLSSHLQEQDWHACDNNSSYLHNDLHIPAAPGCAAAGGPTLFLISAAMVMNAWGNSFLTFCISSTIQLREAITNLIFLIIKKIFCEIISKTGAGGDLTDFIHLYILFKRPSNTMQHPSNILQNHLFFRSKWTEQK